MINRITGSSHPRAGASEANRAFFSSMSMRIDLTRASNVSLTMWATTGIDSLQALRARSPLGQARQNRILTQYVHAHAREAKHEPQCGVADLGRLGILEVRNAQKAWARTRRLRPGGAFEQPRDRQVVCCAALVGS